MQQRITESNLGRLRLDAGMSQTALAKKMGLSPTQQSDMERGETLPNAERVKKLAKLLGCTQAVIEDAARKDAYRYAQRLMSHRAAGLDLDPDQAAS